jgi:hypothetical protein
VRLSTKCLAYSVARLLKLLAYCPVVLGRATPTPNPEPKPSPHQEFFLVPRDAYYQRTDLQLSGRTVMGMDAPRGQERSRPAALLPATCYLLPTTHHVLPTTYYPPPTACFYYHCTSTTCFFLLVAQANRRHSRTCLYAPSGALGLPTTYHPPLTTSYGSPCNCRSCATTNPTPTPNPNPPAGAVRPLHGPAQPRGPRVHEGDAARVLQDGHPAQHPPPRGAPTPTSTLTLTQPQL